MKKVICISVLILITAKVFSQVSWATFTLPSSSCVNLTGTTTAVTGTNTALGYTWTSSSSGASILNPNNSSTVIFYSTSGQYTITLTADNGTNISVYSQTITINSLPFITSTGPTSAICPPPTSIGGLMMTAGGALTYTWMPGGVVGANYWATQPYASTNFTVYGTDANGCVGETYQYVNVISGGINISGPTLACAGSSICLSVSGTPLVLYSWSGPCGFSGNSPNECFTINSGCAGKYVVGGNDMTCMWVDTINIAVSPCTEIKETLINEMFKAYPNPVNEKLSLFCDLCNEVCSFQLLDILGRVILTKEMSFENGREEIDFSELNQGIYFIRAFDSNYQLINKKIVKGFAKQ